MTIFGLLFECKLYYCTISACKTNTIFLACTMHVLSQYMNVYKVDIIFNMNSDVGIHRM